MLRSLFISLIILSALSSDGISAVPEYIYNLYLNPDSLISNSEKQECSYKLSCDEPDGVIFNQDIAGSCNDDKDIYCSRLPFEDYGLIDDDILCRHNFATKKYISDLSCFQGLTVNTQNGVNDCGINRKNKTNIINNYITNEKLEIHVLNQVGENSVENNADALCKNKYKGIVVLYLSDNSPPC